MRGGLRGAQIVLGFGCFNAVARRVNSLLDFPEPAYPDPRTEVIRAKIDRQTAVKPSVEFNFLPRLQAPDLVLDVFEGHGDFEPFRASLHYRGERPLALDFTIIRSKGLGRTYEKCGSRRFIDRGRIEQKRSQRIPGMGARGSS